MRVLAFVIWCLIHVKIGINKVTKFMRKTWLGYCVVFIKSKIFEHKHDLPMEVHYVNGYGWVYSFKIF